MAYITKIPISPLRGGFQRGKNGSTDEINEVGNIQRNSMQLCVQHER